MFTFVRINNMDEWVDFIINTKPAFRNYEDWREFFDIKLVDVENLQSDDIIGYVLTPARFPCTVYFYIAFENRYYGSEYIQHIDWFFDEDDISVSTMRKRIEENGSYR